MTFAILSTIAFGLIFLALLGKVYLKGKKFMFFKWGSNNSTTMFITAALILLVIAVWICL
jgi:hypothetical protein